MSVLSETEGLALLLLFGFTMLSFVWCTRRSTTGIEEFLLARRSVGMWKGAFSIAVSWMWAPAIFICSLQAYTNGVAGIFWFTAPNILCFFLFAPFAVRIRRSFPQGYTLPQAIDRRFSSKRTHLAFLSVFIGYQFGALVINAVAGGALLHLVSGIETHIAIILMTCIALTYSLLGGLRASINTDVLQLSLILLVSLVLVPWCVFGTPATYSVSDGLGGFTGKHNSIFDAHIAYTMGIPMTLSLLAGPFGDQMFFQRAFAVKETAVAKTFIVGGLIFSVVPIALSSLGFLGASMANANIITVSDPQMVGPQVIAHLLPKPALYVFTLMAIAALCSTMDSALCALSSLTSIDIYRRYANKHAQNAEILRVSRGAMILAAILASGIALLQPKLLWVFLIYGALASAGVFPAIFALSWKRVSAEASFWAIACALAIGMPLSFYANIQESPDLIVVSAVVSVAVGLCICLVSGFLDTIKEAQPGLRVSGRKQCGVLASSE